MDFLDDLNEQQRKAVTAGAGQVLVLAGPGSGKTRVLTYRIAYLLKAQGVRPWDMLAVTFTNKAARSMQTRVEDLLHLPANQSDIWLGTFHATCARLLRREVKYLPYESNFVIMDADDQLSIVKRCIKDLNLNDKLYRPTSVHAAISNAKNNLLLPDNLPARSYREEVIVRIYQRYQQILQASNGVDFDDLLLWAVKLLQDNPEVRERYARRFEHILVDEFQDTNVAQYELLHLLAGEAPNLFVVGDEDQSIYRWRGADYRNVLRFEEDYPSCQKILLEQNYRSTQTVLDAARMVIDRNPYRTPKHLSSARGVGGERITLFEAADDHGEAAYVVDSIGKLLAGGKGQGGDFAIMYRTNAQSRLLEEAFLHAGLPYRLVGALRFYGRREVKDMIAFLRLAQNPADEVSMLRVINVPPRGIGDKTLVALQLAARQANCSPGAVLLDLGRNGQDSPFWKTFAGRGAAVLADFGALLAAWNEAALTSLPTLFDRILADTVYQEHIDDDTDEGKDRWANVQELRKLAYEYQERGLTAFLENLALVSDQDTLPDQTNVPTLLTLHAAKGLEFKQVFIIGLDEGLLPHSRSKDDPEEMAEERRLFYVGITRTKDRLCLVRTGQRSTYGSFEYCEPSRFLQDIPAQLLQALGAPPRPVRRRNEDWASLNRWEPVRGSTGHYSPPPPPNAPIIEMRYRPGMRVRHPVWGEGLILESKVIDGEETVDATFESVGFKRLIAALAKLEIIS